MPSLRSAVREFRERSGLSQAELASRIGISRQALGKLEAGTSQPNLATALLLARVLGCEVEQLFTFEHAPVAERLECEGDLVEGQRVIVGRVAGRWIAHALDELHAGLARADGLVRAPASGVDRWQIELRGDRRALADRLLIAGCAPSLGPLAELAREHALALGWIPTDSQRALALLARGRVHLAGMHLRDELSGSYNLPQLRRALPDRRTALLALTRWSAGLALAPGNPLRIREPKELLREGLRLAHRQVGSGAAELLRQRLRGLGRAEGLAGPRARGHLDVATLIRSGAADAGVTIEPVAHAAGLAFVPLADERFDLALLAETLDDPRVGALIDLLGRDPLRRELAPFPGEDTSDAGRVTLA